MKKLLFILLLFPLFTFGQDSLSTSINPFPKDESGNIHFTFVIESDLPSSTLFRNAKTWIATTPVSTKSRTYTPKISMEDVSTGRIIVEYLDSSYTPGKNSSESMTVVSTFKITFDCKDKKYRYKIEDYADVLKYGNKEYTTTFLTLHDAYEKNNSEPSALNMSNFFTGISESIEKAMSVDDDF